MQEDQNHVEVNYLDLTQITFPTGGTISYTWVNGSILSGGGCSVASPDDSRFVHQRIANANDGSQQQISTYSYSPPTTVTDAQNNYVVHWFNSLNSDGACNEYETDTFWYNSSHTLLKKVHIDYSGMFYPFYPEEFTNLDVNVHPIRTTTTLYPSNQVTKVETDYDSSIANIEYWDPYAAGGNGQWLGVGGFSRGLVLQKREYAYGNGAPGALVRCTAYDYEALDNSAYMNANILDLPSSVKVYAGACGTGTLMSQTTNTYDGSTLTSSGVTTQFDSSKPNPGIRGNLTSVQRWLNTGGNVTTSTEYYNTGMPYQSTDGNGNTTTYSYSPTYAGGLLTQTQLPNTGSVQHIVKGTYDFNTGLLTSYTDQNNNSTTFAYDGLSRMLTATFPDTGVTTLSYPDFNTVTETVTNGTTTTTKFDGLGRKSHVILNDPSGNDTTDYTYDWAGRLASVSNPYRSTSDPTYGITQYTYDPLNRKMNQTQQDGSTEQWTYDASGTVGDTAAYQDEVGNIWQRTSDALGRLTTVLEPNAAETDYQYDVLNDLTRVDQWGGPYGSSGDRVRTFVYNSLGELTSATNPESGTTSYAYDANGNVIQRTRPLPNQTSATVYAKTAYYYDADDRLYLKTYTDNNVTSTTTPSVYTDYDLTANASIQDTLSNKGKDLIGRKVDAYVKFGTGAIIAGEAYSYDQMGRIWDNPQCSPDNCATGTYAVAYTYDPDGKILTGSNGLGNTFTYGYNTAAQLTSIVSSWNDSQHPPHLLSALQYSPLGAMAAASYGNGAAEALSYNSKRGWLTGDLVSGFTSTGSPATLYSLAVTAYAADGDITAVTDSVNGPWAYTYDNLRRLQTATLNPSGSPSQLTWVYDKWGNRVSQTITEGTLPWSQDTFTFTGNNQILQYGYDAAGNVTSDGTHSYTYDDEGRIVSVDNGGTGTYVYNADGLRVRRAGSEGPEDYVYDLSDQAVSTILPSGGAQRREVYAGSVHVATYDDLTTFFDHADWQGTERVRSNVSGVSTLTCTNLPFGDDQSCVGPLDPTPTHFTGKLWDGETGLNYASARYYSSNAGRWMLPDWSAVPAPIPYADMSNPQTLNLYTYVGNNPISGIDSDGHSSEGSNGQPCGFYRTFLNTNTGLASPAQVPCSSPTPPPQPAAGNKAQQQKLINAQDAARNDPKNAPAKDGTTFCNVATCHIAKAVGAPTGALTNPKDGQAALANQIAANLGKSGSGYRQVTPQEAQQLANQGMLVIAVQPHPGHGHVATVRPGGDGSDPLINNIGKHVDVRPASRAFYSSPAVKYYTPQ